MAEICWPGTNKAKSHKSSALPFQPKEGSSNCLHLLSCFASFARELAMQIAEVWASPFPESFLCNSRLCQVCSDLVQALTAGEEDAIF